MSLKTDREAFIAEIESPELYEDDQGKVAEYTEILDEFIAWAKAQEPRLVFYPSELNVQSTVAFRIPRMGTAFMSAYPQKGVPTKLSVIDLVRDDNHVFPPELQADAAQRLAELETIKPDKPQEQPRISFNALLDVEKRRAVKGILQELLYKLGSQVPQPEEPEDPEPPETPHPFDFSPPAPAQRRLVEEYRVLRDSVMARKVKRIHNCRCQVCGAPGIPLLDGTLYAEAHHIKPVGGTYSGDDHQSNVLCVCPTCHVKLDYGTIQIEYEKLIKDPRHEVSEEMVEFHNGRLYGKKR